MLLVRDLSREQVVIKNVAQHRAVTGEALMTGTLGQVFALLQLLSVLDT